MNEANIKKKSDQVNEVGALLQKYDTFLIFEYSSLKADEIASIRKELYRNGAILRVFKNNILLRAFSSASVSDYDQALVGQNAIVFGNDASIIKIIGEAIKEKELAKVKIGRLQNNTITAEQALRIVELGSKNDLIVQLLFVMQAPLRNFAAALCAVRDAKANESANG